MASGGRRPTTRERALRRAIETLDPARGLDKIDEAAGRVTGAVGFAAVVAGGFGLVTATELDRVGTGWALPTLIAAAISVVCAIWATVPVKATLRPGDLAAAEAWFDDQLTRRSRLIRAAAAFLGAAILLATLPSIVSAARGSAEKLDVQAAYEAPNRWSFTVSVEDAPIDATVTIAAEGQDDSLVRSTLDVESDGSASRDFSMTSETRSVQLAATLQDSGKVLSERRVTLRARP